jgi:DNA-binding NtrC family response regulator
MRSAFHSACEQPLQFVAMNYMPVPAAAGTLAAHFAPDFVPFTNHRHGMARILLVEDDANVLMLLEHVLRGDGHDVDTASTVEQARSHLAQRRDFDLVLADGRLPDGTGMEVGDAAADAGIKTLIITGFAFQLPREELGRYDYLLKPVRPAELLRAIGRMLESCSRSSTASQ